MKITFNSPVILWFAFLTVVIYILTNYLNIGNVLFVLPSTFNFNSTSAYLKLITYVFGHQDSAHLIGNMSFFLLLGPIIEEKYGSKLTIALILATALITAVLHIMFFNLGLQGASGIVLAFIITVSLVNFKNGELPITFILVVIIFLGQEFMNAFENDNISQFAHIIGGVIGAFFGFKFQPKIESKELNDL